MTAAPSIQPRREDRIAIESVNLPFPGTRVEDMSLFQYLLLDSFTCPHLILDA